MRRYFRFIYSLIFFMTMGELLFAQAPTLMYDKDNLLLERGATVTLTVDNLDGDVEATVVPADVVRTVVNGNTVALTALCQGVAKLTFASPAISLLVYVTDKGKVTLWEEDWSGIPFEERRVVLLSDYISAFGYSTNASSYCVIEGYFGESNKLRISKYSKTNEYHFVTSIPNKIGCVSGNLTFDANKSTFLLTFANDCSLLDCINEKYQYVVDLATNNNLDLTVSSAATTSVYFDNFLLTSTLPGVKVHMGSGGIATFSSTLPLDFSGTELKAYVATGFGEGVVNFERVEQVPPCTGVLLTGAAGEYTIPIAEREVPNVGTNYMVATPTPQYVEGAEGVYLLGRFSETEAIAFHLLSTRMMSAAGKAYLKLPVSGAYSVKMKFVDRPNSVEAPCASRQKGAYTLQGVRVATPTQPGVYIVDGKKRIMGKRF